MKKIFTKKNLLIFASLTLVVLVIYIIKSLNPPFPQIVTTIPPNNSPDASIYNPVEIFFDKEVDPTQIVVTSSPDESWVIESTGINSVSLTHQKYFYTGQKYTIQINYNHKPLSTLTFTTQQEKNDPRYLQDVQAEMDKDYPMSLKLPYDTNAYRVVYGSPLTLEIRRKNNALSDSEMINQVKKWVQENGFDPATHKYVVVTPTPTPSPNF